MLPAVGQGGGGVQGGAHHPRLRTAPRDGAPHSLVPHEVSVGPRVGNHLRHFQLSRPLCARFLPL